MNRTKLTILFLILAVVPAVAQNLYDGHSEKMFASVRPKYTLSSLEEIGLEKWQASFRSELRTILGIPVIEASLEGTGFQPSATFIRSEDDGTMMREWWEITTEPDVAVKFIVMKPKDLKGRVPLMIATHGHSKSTEISAGIYQNEAERSSGEDGERNVGVQAVQHGFIAIAPAMRGFGDTRHPDDIAGGNTSSCYDLYLRDALVGRTPVGDRVWDVMRIIDWALAELPVDSNNVVISGNSGGGTVSIYAAAVDTRITMSVPGSAFSTFERSIEFRRHCSCNYVNGILQLGDMGEIAGLVAPRAFCAVNGKDDDLFHLDGAQKAIEVTRQIYVKSGVPDNCALFVGHAGHRYYKDGAWEFIMSHLNQTK